MLKDVVPILSVKHSSITKLTQALTIIVTSGKARAIQVMATVNQNAIIRYQNNQMKGPFLLTENNAQDLIQIASGVIQALKLEDA